MYFRRELNSVLMAFGTNISFSLKTERAEFISVDNYFFVHYE